MCYTNFEYSVSLRQDSTSPLAAELTCTKVVRKKFHLFTDETHTLSLPDQPIELHTNYIPLIEPNYSTNTQIVFGIVRHPNRTTVISRPSKTNDCYSLDYTRISDIMSSFGVINKHCRSTILREIDMAVKSSSRGRGVVEIKICKVKTEVYEFNRAAEEMLIESYHPNPAAPRVYNSTRREQECVICMQGYSMGSIVTKLACSHDFHGLCIHKWSQVNHLCPLCRSPITHLI